MILLVLVFYFTHYLFASITAHVTALLPVMLAVGMSIPGINMPEFALLLCLTLGIMGVLTPFATGPSPVYYGSGYLPSKDYWRLGAIFGVLFIVVLVVVAVPWLALIGYRRVVAGRGRRRRRVSPRSTRLRQATASAGRAARAAGLFRSASWAVRRGIPRGAAACSR